MRARWYDTSIGRFLSEDTIQDGLNWYVYASSNPVNKLDPFGLATVGLRDYAGTYEGSTVEWDDKNSIMNYNTARSPVQGIDIERVLFCMSQRKHEFWWWVK